MPVHNHVRLNSVLEKSYKQVQKTAAFVVTFEKYITFENKTIKTEYFCNPTWINTIQGY